MTGPESIKQDPTEKPVVKLFTAIFRELTPQQRTTLWADQVFEEYKTLSRQTAQKRLKNLVTQTASELLKNPQDISTAEEIWKTNDLDIGCAQESDEPFSKLVERKCQALTKEKWCNIVPEQLAQLVKISSNSNDPVQEHAREMLKNYFKGPESSNQRIDAYYNFVSATLDLVGECDAFKEGMKIALHGTEILPKKPSLLEQAFLVSLPYDKKSVSKKLLIVNYIIYQLRLTDLVHLDEYYKERKKFIDTKEATEAFRTKEQRVIKKIGSEQATELHSEMIKFFRIITNPLSEEKRESLKGDWPYSLAFDETDPLIEKFRRVLQLASS